MNHAHFMDITAGADVASLSEARYATALRVLSTSAGPDINPHAPFTDTEYPFYQDVGTLSRGHWATLRADPRKLVRPLPFGPSEVRPGGLAVWDAAIAIPATAERTRPIHPGKLAARLHINREWETTTMPGLLSAANAAPTCAPGVVDLRRRGAFGWRVINAAHALVHRRNHWRPPADEPARLLGCYVADMARAAAEVMFAMLYGTPMYVGAQDRYKLGRSNGPYGLRIVGASGALVRPVLSMPWTGTGAMAVDRVTACVGVSLSVGPAPYRYYQPDFVPSPHHKWVGLPCTLAVAGWEGVDMLTHAPLVQPDAGRPNPSAVPRYSLPVADLWPASTIPAMLLAGAAYPETEDKDWMCLGDWLASPDYADLAARTPPLPCPDCCSIRPNTIDAPPRPRRDAEPREWVEYAATVNRIFGLCKSRAEDGDAECAGTQWANAVADRKRRTRAYKADAELFRKVAQFDELQAKIDRGFALTDAGRRRYQALLDAYGLPRLMELSKVASGGA